MLVEIIDGKIKGFKTVSEMSKLWNMKPGAIRQSIRRGNIETLFIGNEHFIAEDTPRPNNKPGRPKGDKK